MLWRLCSNVMATSWQRRSPTLSQRRRPTSPQLSFSTVPQRFDNVNHDVVTTLSQRRCASWEGIFTGQKHIPSSYQFWIIWLFISLCTLNDDFISQKSMNLYQVRYLAHVKWCSLESPWSIYANWVLIFDITLNL